MTAEAATIPTAAIDTAIADKPEPVSPLDASTPKRIANRHAAIPAMVTTIPKALNSD